MSRRPQGHSKRIDARFTEPESPNGTPRSEKRALSYALLSALVLGSLITTPASAKAQTAPVLFEEGMQHAAANRWEEALEAFQRAYELEPLPAILVNIGTSEARLGMLVSARGNYHRFFELADEDDPLRPDAERELEFVESRLPRVVLEGPTDSDSDQIFVDEVRYELEPDGSVLVDPGEHDIAVHRDGERYSEGVVVISERQTQTLRLGLVEPEVLGGDESSSLFESPWFWTITAVLLAGAVVTTVLLLQPPEPFMGNGGWATVP